jgi:hypothetical protein
VREVGLVHGVRASQLLPQWDYQDSWKYSYAVLAALTIAHNDGPALKFDILDAQTHRLEDAHPCAVEKAADQMMRPMQASQTVNTSSRVKTTGSRTGFLARSTPSSHGNSSPSTSLYRNANYYAAFVIGPDGHNIEVVCHEPEA